MAGIQGIYPLKGVVQHYNWGGFLFIPQLLQQPNEAQKPCAEYWLGAHPAHPATITALSQELPLNKFIESDGAAILGGAANAQFGRLPYLLKVLDVRQMLSIQVHPDKASAEAGFETENRLGIAVNAPHRNYKDDNHKPELMVALSDFWLLHGFKPAALLKETLEAIPEFSFLLQAFEAGSYEAVYRKAMTLPQDEVNAILQPLVERILPLYKNGELLKSQEDFWAARAADTFCKEGHYDRGIFSIYLFNLLHLKKGEGIYQAARLPHAYLEGQNVELMSASDNVLRAGLTDKHIDVAELLKHVRYEETVPMLLGAHAEVEEAVQFSAPVPEFELYQYKLEGHSFPLEAASAEILMVLNGGATLTSGTKSLTLQKGEAAFVTAGVNYSLSSGGVAEVFRAAVPQNEKEGDSIS